MAASIPTRFEQEICLKQSAKALAVDFAPSDADGTESDAGDVSDRIDRHCSYTVRLDVEGSRLLGRAGQYGVTALSFDRFDRLEKCPFADANLR